MSGEKVVLEPVVRIGIEEFRPNVALGLVVDGPRIDLDQTWSPPDSDQPRRYKVVLHGHVDMTLAEATRLRQVLCDHAKFERAYAPGGPMYYRCTTCGQRVSVQVANEEETKP